MIGTVAAAAFVVAACGKKAAEGPSVEELRGEVAGVTEELNAYMSEHNFSNTDAGELESSVKTLAGKYGELEKQSRELEGQSGEEGYGDLAGLAGEGRAAATALAAALAAGPPRGDTAKATALHGAIGEWAAFSEEVGPAPDVSEPAEPAPPGEAEPAPPGEGEPYEPGPGEPEPGEPEGPGEPEPGEPEEPGEPGEPRYPGKGHHYGWWKNPEWARDPASREGDVGAPGAGEKEREREREPKGVSPGKGGGPGGVGAGDTGSGADKGGGKGKDKGKSKGKGKGGVSGG
jgi:hypothetical protein